MDIIKGKVWVFEDNVDTDQVLPGYAMAEAFEDLGKFAMAGSSIPNFSKEVQAGDIIVAGKNFGGGSSREQAPYAIQKAGVSAIVAKSYARIFRRNSINIGLPVISADILDKVKTGDIISIDIDNEKIEINGEVVKTLSLAQSVVETLNAGGLINRVREELKAEGRL